MINSMAAALNGEKDTWVAGPNIFFEGKSDRDAKALLGKRAAGAEAVARRRGHGPKVKRGVLVGSNALGVGLVTITSGRV